MDQPAPFLLVDPTALTEGDHRALAQMTAGYLLDSEVMAARLGGWQVARSNRPNIRMSEDRAEPHGEAVALLWTEAAIADYDRTRTLLAGLSDDAERRFAAAVVAAMVRAIVDGGGWASGIGDIPLLANLALRLSVTDGRLVVLGLRHDELVR